MSEQQEYTIEDLVSLVYNLSQELATLRNELDEKHTFTVYPHAQGELIEVKTRRAWRPTWQGKSALKTMEIARNEMNQLIDSGEYIWNPNALIKLPSSNGANAQTGNRPPSVTGLPTLNGGDENAVYERLDMESDAFAQLEMQAESLMTDDEIEAGSVLFWAPAVTVGANKAKRRTLGFVGYNGEIMQGLVFTDKSTQGKLDTAHLNPFSESAKHWHKNFTLAMWQAALMQGGKTFWTPRGVWFIVTPTEKEMIFNRVLNEGDFQITAWTVNNPF